MPEIISTGSSGLQLVTEEVQEIISYRPHWIIRSGNLIFMAIILLLLALTWFIKYPDIVNTKARLVALNPPKLIKAKTDGKLLGLLVENGQHVTKGQHLGYMESTGDYEEVISLQHFLDKTIEIASRKNYEQLKDSAFPQLNNLGELQAPYQLFHTQWEITQQTLGSGYYNQRKSSIAKDLDYLAALKNKTYKQINLQQQDRQLQQAEFDAYEKLAADKVIAPLELNAYKSKLLAQDQNLEQTSAQITSSEINSLNKRKELQDLQKQVADQQQQFNSALLQLKSDLEKWIQQYVLIAPENGKVLFVSTLQENEMIGNGQAMFFIQPSGTRYYVEMIAGQKGFGKLKTGQQVMIKTEGFPSDEFGYLKARVNFISEIPNRSDSFLVKAELTNGLETNYGKQIFFRNGLEASGEIITDNRKLSDRLLGQLNQVWKR